MEVLKNKSNQIQQLSEAARSLWAKSPQSWIGKEAPEGSWLPLYKHMNDSAEIGRQLWANWVSSAIKKLVNEKFDFAEKLFIFFAAVHDVGKATPEFQYKKTRDDLCQYVKLPLPIGPMQNPNAVPHSLAGHIILKKFLLSDSLGFTQDEADTYADIIGGHHGGSWGSDRIDDASESYRNNTGFKNKEWQNVQNELVNYALSLSKLDFMQLDAKGLSVQAQAILTSLVIMADWLASNEDLFPYESLEDPRNKSSTEYAEEAWKRLAFLPHWAGRDVWSGNSVASFFRMRFDLPKKATPYPMQEEVGKIAITAKSPGIMVVEAPMGEGKTEAALIAAEILAHRTKRSGLFFALPTQATTDGIFPRITEWMDKLDNENHAVFLAHGKSELNESYRNLQKIWMNLNVYDDDTIIQNEKNTRQHNASIHEWMQGRKTGILADFVVGTIDQVLMGALKKKHLALRHLGLADKVVVIDECHAYDAYMSQYLEDVLGWLGLYGTPVVILSATLPSRKRESLVNAYLGHKEVRLLEEKASLSSNGRHVINAEKHLRDWAHTRAYPLITYSDGHEIRSVQPSSSGRKTTVILESIDDDIETLIRILIDLLSDGGCVGIIRNTVRRAQETAQALEAVFGIMQVELFHSQFLSNDRIHKESKLRRKLGKNGERPTGPFIVVGTQVLEQSLDIDFDLMVTDLAPIDLLLQRLGRLHRHFGNYRSKKLKDAKCYITGITHQGEDIEFEKGSETVYGKYLLMMSYLRLHGVESISLPDDIPDLVQDVYQKGAISVPSAFSEAAQVAEDEYDERIHNKEIRAKSFLIRNAYTAENLIGWLSTPAGDSEIQGEATVRDTADSLEVILVYRNNASEVHLLPWVESSIMIKDAAIPTERAPQSELGRTIAECTVKLPSILCAPWLIDKVIAEIEESASRQVDAWQESHWIKGALVLILNEKYETSLCGYHLRYEEKWGLSAQKEPDENPCREEAE